MTKLAIEVDGIGKLYRLEHAGTGTKSFRDALTDMARAPLRRLRRLRGSDKSMEDFWALKDVTFDVAQGDVVGIIGRNGAGKSTLLKILSRIVEPTIGQVTMRGRVASLLEVGTGFHPELSGRENVYLNGSILGMKKREIDRRFDEIVAFAEVEKFLDTPVKRYSSGMYVRLAFAVAAHLEPEILIVDEVLAVGDAEFQKRCLGKMQEISKSGSRTVLFVSHNMAAIRSLCSKGILLNRGRVEATGDAASVVDTYMSAEGGDLSSTKQFAKGSSASVWMKSAQILADGLPSSAIAMGSDISFKIEFGSQMALSQPRLGYVISTAAGDRVLNSNNRFQSSNPLAVPSTEGTVRCELGKIPLMPGRYSISLWCGDEGGDHHIEWEALYFDVIERDLWGLGKLPPAVATMWWPTSYEVKS